MSTTQNFLNRLSLSANSAHALVADALKGAEDGELYLEDSVSEYVSRTSQPKKVGDGLEIQTATSFDEDAGYGLRHVVDGNYAYAFGTRFDAANIRDAGARLQTVMGTSKNSVFAAPGHGNNAFYMPNNPLAEMDTLKKLKLLEDIDTYIRNKDARVYQVSVALSGSFSNICIIRPDGFMADDVRPLVQLRINVMVMENGRREQSSNSVGGRMGYAFVSDPDTWQSYADEALKSALTMLSAVACPSGEMPVVLGNGWAGVLLHEAIGHPLEGDANANKSSNFHNKMGQQVAAKGVTIVDDGTNQNGRGALNMDDEGTATEKTLLIDDGKLVGLMHDRISARKLGTTSTGSGRRESFRHPVLPRMRSTYMLGGNADPADIIKNTKHGIYITNFGGGQVSSATGQFTFKATFAMLIENGVLTQPLKGATLIGNPYDALMHMDMIGNDFALDAGVGSCGKQGQSLPVNLGQPTLRLVGGVTVGGTA